MADEEKFKFKDRIDHISDSYRYAAMKRINEDLFFDMLSSGTTPLPPPTLWMRLRVKWMLVRDYLSVLWRAVKGEDPYSSDDDYY